MKLKNFPDKILDFVNLSIFFEKKTAHVSPIGWEKKYYFLFLFFDPNL